MSIRIVTVKTNVRLERRWRWSWLRLRWVVQTLVEDYVFTSGDPSACIEGMEQWEAIGP